MKYFLKIFIFISSMAILFSFSAVKAYPTWFKHYGGVNADAGYSIIQTSDGGYIAAGRTASYTYGSDDFAIYRLDSSGNKVWFRHYGGTNSDIACSIQQTSDGGYVVAGQTLSYTFGQNDFAIYKLDSGGNKVWFKHYGGINDDSAYSIQQTSDGDYIVAGYTGSYTYGGNDFAIYKLDSSGNKVWFKHYGGSESDYGYPIQQTSDGGYIVAGVTESFTYGSEDFAIYKLDSSGNKVWFKHYGSTNNDGAQSIQQTSDGGYIVAGYTQSDTYGGYDFGIYKLNSSGNKVWFKHYGGLNGDVALSIQQTTDGGYVVAGPTESFTIGGYDILIFKLDSSGEDIWLKRYGDRQNDTPFVIRQTSDGGYIVVGETDSYSFGDTDFAIYKLNSNGNK